MALLLLGVVLNPVLGYIGDLHASEHASVSSETDVDHHHQVEAAVEDDAAPEGGESDVWHEVMHVSHTHGTSMEALLVPIVVPVAQKHAAVSPPTAPLTPLQHIAGPFRPPIV